MYCFLQQQYFYFLLYCLGRQTCWSCCLLTHDTLIMAMIAFAGPLSTVTVLLDTTGDVLSLYCLQQQQQHLERQNVIGGHISNINNLNMSSIKTIGNPMSIAGPRFAAVLLSACHDYHCHCRIAFDFHSHSYF